MSVPPSESDLLRDIATLMSYLARAQTVLCPCGRPTRAAFPPEVRTLVERIGERMQEWRKAVAEYEEVWPKNVECGD